MHTLDIAPLHSESPPQNAQVWHVLKGSQFYLHTHTFIHNRNKPYLPLPSQPQLVLICRPRRDGRLSRPWCEVVQAEIRTRNLPIANPALYHTATSAPRPPKEDLTTPEKHKPKVPVISIFCRWRCFASWKIFSQFPFCFNLLSVLQWHCNKFSVISR